MKRIIGAIAVTLAIGSAASGQTKAEVEEILEEAKGMELAGIETCRRGIAGESATTADWKSIGDEIKRHYGRMLRGTRVTDSQLYEAVCRGMMRREMIGMAKSIEANNRECTKHLDKQKQKKIAKQAKEWKENRPSTYAKITEQQLTEALCEWEKGMMLRMMMKILMDGKSGG